uniref:Uncharacterized protein n=1 Tax=Anguilla anguilla TaxID=7936 RepID=A0A0E9T635_ANGAN
MPYNQLNVLGILSSFAEHYLNIFPTGSSGTE